MNLDVNVDAITGHFRMLSTSSSGSADNSLAKIATIGKKKHFTGRFNMLVFEHPSFFIDPKALNCLQFL
jgi:hypothetical protein